MVIKTGIPSPDEAGIEVKLNRDEYIIATTTGLNRAEAHTRATPVGKTALRSHSEGAIGEMMVCKHLGIPFNNVITGEYPGDVDVKILDYRVDVKATNYWDDPVLLVKQKVAESEDAKSDMYINVRLRDEGRIPHRGEIMGFISRDNMLDRFVPRNWPENTPWPNYAIEWGSYNLFEKFEERLPDYERENPIVRRSTADIIEHIDFSFLGYGDPPKQTAFGEWL